LILADDRARYWFNTQKNGASTEGLVKALKPELNKIFKPAFLGRMVIVPYFLPFARRR
jgi:ATP-dependent Clp protease ATP-binding subunit ClpA